MKKFSRFLGAMQSTKMTNMMANRRTSFNSFFSCRFRLALAAGVWNAKLIVKPYPVGMCGMCGMFNELDYHFNYFYERNEGVSAQKKC